VTVLEFDVLQLHIQLLVALRESLVAQDVLGNDTLGCHRLILLDHAFQVGFHLTFVRFELIDLTLELSALLVDCLGELLNHF
jgi:hypothetical protein